MPKDNLHNDDQILAFADEMLDFVNQHKEAMLAKIADFHEPSCTAPESEKEACLLNFSLNFLALLTQLAADREMEAIKNAELR